MKGNLQQAPLALPPVVETPFLHSERQIKEFLNTIQTEHLQ